MLSPWITALIVGGISAAAAGLAHDIQGFVSGKTPWDDPGEWTKGALKAGAIGFGGGALGSLAGAAVGPMLGGAESALGSGASVVGENAGTTAVQAGAMTPADVAGVIPKAAGEIMSGGMNAPAGLFKEAIGQMAKNTFSGAVSGAAQNYEDPLQGALMGGAQGAASSAFTQGAGAIMKGSGGSVVSPAATRGYSMQPAGHQFGSDTYSLSGGDSFQRAYNPQAEGFSIGRSSPAMSPPSFSDGLIDTGMKVGARGAGAAARMGVGSAFAPPTPPDPMQQNPYAQWGVQPYWARRM